MFMVTLASILGELSRLKSDFSLAACRKTLPDGAANLDAEYQQNHSVGVTSET